MNADCLTGLKLVALAISALALVISALALAISAPALAISAPVSYTHLTLPTSDGV